MLLRRIIFASAILASAAAYAQSVSDSTLQVQTWASGFADPTGVAILDDKGTMLVTEQKTGKVDIVRNRKMDGTAIDLPVANDADRGLLGIALSPQFSTNHEVYLYHTVAAQDGGSAIDNEVTRYTWNGHKLVSPENILTLPTGTGTESGFDQGGKMTFDAKGKLYVSVGDEAAQGLTQNVAGSGTVQLQGVILRVNPDGSAIKTNPFYDAKHPTAVQNDIYAYGVRNAFGLAVDPQTNTLWDSENGPQNNDEINRVTTGFNSGWTSISGPQSLNGGTTGALVSLGSAAHYNDPKMTWVTNVAPTDTTFMDTTALGKTYKDDLLVGDVNTGTIFDFDLTSNRKSLQLTGPLADRIANNSDADLLAEQSGITFGSGFGTTTAIINGPGGLYVLSYDHDTLYRITAATASSSDEIMRAYIAVPEPGCLAGVSAAFLVLTGRRSRQFRKNLS